MNNFLTSVADVIAYDSNDNIVLEGNALLNTTLENAVGNTDLRGGKGNKLLFIYPHSGELSGTVENSQFSIDMLALAGGSTITTGANIWTEETVTLTNGAGTVVGTPIGFQGTTVYGWVTYGSVVSERVTMSTKSFTISDTTYNGDVCVRYYAFNSAARSVEIPANAKPAIVRLVMRVDLYSNENNVRTQVGEAIITIFKAAITGAFTINMTPDGIASTPLTWRALASSGTVTGCASAKPLYATIAENIYDAHWYDDVTALAVEGGDFSLANTVTKLLKVYAVTPTESFPVADYSDLTFSATGVTVVNTNGATKGTVTGATGGGTVKVTITAKPAVDITVVVTDPA